MHQWNVLKDFFYMAERQIELARHAAFKNDRREAGLFRDQPTT
jgi:hypothetical protein